MAKHLGTQPDDHYSPYGPPGNDFRIEPFSRAASRYEAAVDSPPLEVSEVIEPPPEPQPRQPPPVHRNWQKHLSLYAATCFTTYAAYRGLLGGNDEDSWLYAGAIMLLLTAHEMGHFLQALRHGVPASLPYFIPMPFSYLGTMGAVIRLKGTIPNRLALFDIGISGPLAGLVPAMIFSIIGVHYAHVAPLPVNLPKNMVLQFGDPLVLQFLVYLMKGPLPAGQDVILNPLLFAGWAGMLLTSLNLFPIGQLDGGHIIYALLGRRSHVVSEVVLLGATFAVVWFEHWQWLPMLILLMVMGPRHTPTADDEVPLGNGRIVLGALTLLFVVVGFTPIPFGP